MADDTHEQKVDGKVPDFADALEGELPQNVPAEHDAAEKATQASIIGDQNPVRVNAGEAERKAEAQQAQIVDAQAAEDETTMQRQTADYIHDTRESDEAIWDEGGNYD